MGRRSHKEPELQTNREGSGGAETRHVCGGHRMTGPGHLLSAQGWTELWALEAPRHPPSQGMSWGPASLPTPLG